MELELKGISKIYNKEKRALSNIDLKLTEGVYGLLGPNGAGKSTLMKIMADVLKESQGRIYLDSKDKKILDEEYRDNIGYLPQDIGFYKNFTAEKFMGYIAALKGMEKRRAKEETERFLKLVNLYEYKNKRIGTFSGGMKQRLGIAQALLNNPKVLILDEPTAGLDPKERIRFRNILSEISGDRIVLLSTHIISDIAYISKEIILIKDGEILTQNSLNELLRSIDGMVWRIKVSEDKYLNIERKYIVSNVFRTSSSIEVRIISDEKPLEDAVKEEPTLEDLYLYYFNEGMEEHGAC
ncbi:ABC transporter ATP-binding protein [Clostridium sp.]|uniref:ABC transporter ATP-binding protein n=1 Tax=Clostridium sp. TaxID=1506 RepID=UPI0034640CF8